MPQITFTNEDPQWLAALALAQGGAPAKPAKSAPVEDDDEEEDTASDSGSNDNYDGMDRRALKREIRSRGILKQVRNSVTDDRLREMLRADDDNGSGEEEEPDDEEEEDDEAEEEEAEEEEDDEEEEEEADVEIGMKVVVVLKGKKQKCVVEDIDYDAGKVKVRCAADKKLYKVAPEKLELA